MSLYVMRSRSRELRIGFSASKRVGKSTVRNHVKRLMREAVRRELPSIYPGQDMVFIARPKAADASYDQIVESVCDLLRKTSSVASATRTASDA